MSNLFGVPPEVWCQILEHLNDYDLYHLTQAGKTFEHLVEIPPFLLRCIEDSVTLPSDRIVTLAKKQKTPIDWETFYNKRPYDTDLAENLTFSRNPMHRCIFSLTETSCQQNSLRECAFVDPEFRGQYHGNLQTELVFASTGLPEWAWKAQGGGLRCLVDCSIYQPKPNHELAYLHAWSNGRTFHSLIYQSRTWEKTNFFIPSRPSTSLMISFFIPNSFRFHGLSVKIDEVDVIRPLSGALVSSHVQQETRDICPLPDGIECFSCTCCRRRELDASFQPVFPPLRFAAGEDG